MTWNHILNVLLTPEVLVPLLTIIIGLLVKAKILTERDVQTAKDMLNNGATVNKVTDHTRLMISEVKQIEATLKAAEGKSTTAKMLAVAQAMARGWLR